MLMVNIILAVSFVPIWPVEYFMTRNFVKPKKNIILGATLPQSAHNAPETQAICRSFMKWLNIGMFPLLPLMIPPYFMSSIGPSMTWHMTWLLIVIVVPSAIFAVHRGKLIALKRERNWYGEASGATFADLGAAAQPSRRISGLWFLPPVLVSLVPVAFSLFPSADWEVAALYVILAASTALLWALYTLIFRARTEIVNEDQTLTMALTRMRRYKWSRFWLLGTWLTGIFNLLMWVFEGNSIAFYISTLIYTLLVIAIAIWTEFSVRSVQQKLTAENVGETYLDEDDYWFWGMFYHNPNDNHFIVNARVGMNMTFNLAKAGAKVIMALTVLCVVALPFIGVWLWIDESVPSGLELSGTELVARHTRDLYAIPLDTIESAELIDEFRVTLKINGTNYDNLYKGRFQIREYGNSFLCLQPQSPPFLVITAGGKTYILGDANAEVTRSVYAELKR